ncbi:hypothetical protein GDO78_003784 [Eleutherodactylus coqui]|uniref:Cell division cycle associated 5 n=1 Tax=Eleutherodactylus coqui TaxID=57060 RepID=A0A8J6K166_ELECQ|nr:hypothetical protein GDO78_003784 [Eleutherodactylus coqui]
MSDPRKRGSSRGMVTWGKDGVGSPRARRSLRNSVPSTKSSDSLMRAPIMKRSITAKKIMPRKTLAALASAEYQPATTSTVEEPGPGADSAEPRAVPAASRGTPEVSNVAAAPRRSSRISPKAEKENAVLDKSQDVAKDVPDQTTTSNIDILSPIPLNIPQSPSYDDRHKVMSQKVRRSYSRLEMSMNGSSFLYSPTKNTDSSDTSTPNPTPNPAPKLGRKTLFGFDNLLISDDVENKKVGEKMKKTLNESSNRSIMKPSAEEPDPNIPGVVLVKQKRRKRRVPQIEVSDLDEWAATMNAQFDEAEKFDLLVE